MHPVRFPYAQALKILRIMRVHIVLGGVLAFSVGTLLAVVAGGSVDFSRVALAYVIVFLGDLSTHYSNDYFDVEVDKYVANRKVFSSSNILVTNPDLRPLSRVMSISMLLLSNVTAAVAVLLQVFPIDLFLLIFATSLLGWFYSAPPLRLISRGFGEIVVAFATGFTIPAMGYLSVRGQLDSFFLLFAFPFMMYGLMLSLSLQVPDIETDRKGGKRTLAVRHGERAVFSLILVSTLTATVAFILYALQIHFSRFDFGIVAFFSIIPLTAGLCRFLRVLQKKDTYFFRNVNVISLFLFNTMTIAYLFTNIFSA